MGSSRTREESSGEEAKTETDMDVDNASTRRHLFPKFVDWGKNYIANSECM